ncbi:MAG: hypothetical protein ACD_39C00576G0001 [uncultured bacterium]|nr:MAG: hypothetical protein ACD_39C00576G0001 [uncultured bacterium]
MLFGNFFQHRLQVEIAVRNVQSQNAIGFQTCQVNPDCLRGYQMNWYGVRRKGIKKNHVVITFWGFTDFQAPVPANYPAMS